MQPTVVSNVVGLTARMVGPNTPNLQRLVARGGMRVLGTVTLLSADFGQVSEPVKTPFGYHLIKVESRGAKPFEEAKPDIEKKMKPQMVREAMDKVKKDTPVTLDDSYFGK